MLLPLSEPVPLLPGTAVRIDHVDHPASAPPPQRFLHFHGPAELVLIEEGCGRFLCEGAEIAFGAGTVLFVPAMAVHDFDMAPGAGRWTLIQFDPHAVPADGVALPLHPAAVAPDPEHLARIAMLARWLSEAIAARASQRTIVLQLQALMLAVTHAVTHAVTNALGPDGAPSPPGSPLTRFRPLLDRLGTDPAATLRLDQAASLCAMSPAYFSRQFGKTFGTGFAAYQTRLKLLQAARILATGDMPVSQIGYALGFASHAHFSQRFRAAFGATPSAYRRRA
eukprot:gene10329-10395_t